MIIKSLLDSDFYKFSMGQVVFFDFPDTIVKYKFTNRGNTQFPIGFADRLKLEVSKLKNIKLQPNEIEWLYNHGDFESLYIEWLAKYQFDENEVVINQVDGQLLIDIFGEWKRIIYWEVILMALISELYFEMTGKNIAADTFSKMEDKGQRLSKANCYWSDFGTRRRFSYEVQDKLVSIMKKYPGFLGTSNPHLAIKHNCNAIGTSAHEANMAMQAIYGIENCNQKWLEHWYNTYDGNLGIALTDTITTDVFLNTFTYEYSNIFDGLRHDSGDPYIWGEKVLNHYNRLGIDPKTKTIVFSDGLTTDKFIKISNHFSPYFKRVIGGIGTHFTNDVGHDPLNIVIKLTEVAANENEDFVPVIKLSDVAGKHNGDVNAIIKAKTILQIT